MGIWHSIIGGNLHVTNKIREVNIYSIISCVSSQIKANELPINKEMTPEQVIEAEYKEEMSNGLHYKYIIDNNIMFVCIEKSPGLSSLAFAFKNASSGFMFKVPGVFSWPIRNDRWNHIDMEDGYQLGYAIGKINSEYYIAVYDTYLKRDIDFFIDKEKMKILELDNNKNRYWVGVIDDLSNFKEVKGNYMGKQIHVIDVDELKALFGEE